MTTRPAFGKVVTNVFERGMQPCEVFVGLGQIQCETCWGWRSSCASCGSDHHQLGWQTCTPMAYRQRPPAG